jgi:hypothetical protein
MTGILIKGAIALGVGLACGPVLAQTEQPAQGQSTECPPGAECPQSQGGEQGQPPAAQGESTGQGEDQSGQQTETPTGEQPAADQGASDQPKQGAAQSETGQQKPDAETPQSGAEQKPAQDEQPQGGSEQPAETDTQQTQQDSSTNVEVTVEQKTEITQIIREEKVEPVEVDIDLSVGVIVPQTVKVKLKPLPPRIVKIVPRYEGYLFFVLADGRIVIVEPSTLKVVVILT